MLKVWVPLAATLLVGCMTGAKFTKRLGNWDGAHIDKAFGFYGAPTSVTPLSNEGKMYEWKRGGGSSTQVNVYGNSAYANTHAKYCNIRLGTDSDGIIRGWSWDGNSCFNPLEPAD